MPILTNSTFTQYLSERTLSRGHGAEMYNLYYCEYAIHLIDQIRTQPLTICYLTDYGFTSNEIEEISNELAKSKSITNIKLYN